ncbi:MAG: hypothetical protein ACK5YR_23050 [Pirellula sp.]|jgi:hypothetical protein
MCRIVILGILFSLGIAFAKESAACPICIGFPSRTDADVLLEAHCVMLGRPDPADQFKYAPGAVLNGSYDGSNIDLLVDSTTSRILQLNSQTHVLLVQSIPNGPWQSLGCMNRALETVVRRILAAGPSWKGPDALNQRMEFFLKLVGHPDSRIHELAYLELGRAPYPMVRQLGRIVPREAIEPMLQERRYYEWRGLAILLMAQGDSEADRQYIRESFQAAERFAVVTHLAAWAAAAIEVDADSTLDQIEEKYFGQGDRTPEELKAIFSALSMHGSLEEFALRDRIVVCYGRLLERLPELAPQVAADMHAWKRNELSGALAHVLEHRQDAMDQAGIIKVQRYLRSVKVAVSTGLPHD